MTTQDKDREELKRKLSQLGSLRGNPNTAEAVFLLFESLIDGYEEKMRELKKEMVEDLEGNLNVAYFAGIKYGVTGKDEDKLDIKDLVKSILKSKL